MHITPSKKIFSSGQLKSAEMPFTLHNINTWQPVNVFGHAQTNSHLVTKTHFNARSKRNLAPVGS